MDAKISNELRQTCPPKRAPESNTARPWRSWGPKTPRSWSWTRTCPAPPRPTISPRSFKDRFFNVGIAEQDLMGTAAGLALGGKIPFASTFAMFATGRAWEQIRQTIAYGNLNVKIVASHGGVTRGGRRRLPPGRGRPGPDAHPAQHGGPGAGRRPRNPGHDPLGRRPITARSTCAPAAWRCR